MSEPDRTTLRVSLGVLLTLGVGLLVACGSESREWYEGGSLHDNTAREWADANHENRLATAADFAAAIWEDRLESFSELRPLANDMKICIDETVLPTPQVPSMKVTEIAAICASLMGW